MKKAVECGYWHLYRYDPRRIAEGKNPFMNYSGDTASAFLYIPQYPLLRKTGEDIFYPCRREKLKRCNFETF